MNDKTKYTAEGVLENVRHLNHFTSGRGVLYLAIIPVVENQLIAYAEARGMIALELAA